MLDTHHELGLQNTTIDSLEQAGQAHADIWDITRDVKSQTINANSMASWFPRPWQLEALFFEFAYDLALHQNMRHKKLKSEYERIGYSWVASARIAWGVSQAVDEQNVSPKSASLWTQYIRMVLSLCSIYQIPQDFIPLISFHANKDTRERTIRDLLLEVTWEKG